MEKTTKTVGYFVLLSNPGVMAELHATGCRDLHGFNEDSIVAESATAAIAALTEAGKLAADAKVRIMPCTNPVRMRAINRLFEVDAETGEKVVPIPEPVAEAPAAEVVPDAPPAEETPAVSKSAAKKLRKAAKKAAAKATETTEEAAVA